jgi:hypothetical protein
MEVIVFQEGLQVRVAADSGASAGFDEDWTDSGGRKGVPMAGDES